MRHSRSPHERVINRSHRELPDVRGCLLDLRVIDRTDPVKVGEEAEFEITVQNLRLQAVSEVQLDVQTSEQLRAASHTAKVGDREIKLTATQRDGALMERRRGLDDS